MSRARNFLNIFVPRPSDPSSAAAATTSGVVSKNIEISQVNFFFEIPHFGRSKIVLSPTACVRNLPWTIMVQLNESETEEGVCAFVICDYKPDNSWSCNAKISLNLLSSDAKRNYRMSFIHRFDRTERLQGFDPFISWTALTHPQSGFVRDNKIVLEVTMKCDEPKCVPWNSKKHTRYIGLENKTENSLLNALIQIVYSIKAFRTCVNAASIEYDSQRVIWEMRQIFYRLNVSDDATIRNLKVHGTEYFFHLLGEKNPSTKRIRDLFHGQMAILSTSTTQFEITNFRKFNGFKLKISADGHIDQSIKEYLTSTGEFGTTIDGSALQRWLHGLIRIISPVNNCYHIHLTQLPWMLLLHSDRQQNNSHFYLSEFVQKRVDSSTRYGLHAVLVRSGDSFVAFVKRTGATGWLKFDNDIVSHCTEKEAIDDDFRSVQMLVYECKGSRGDDDDDDNCIICMEVRRSSVIYSTVCGHVFCGPCITMEISLLRKCPVCKKDLTEKDIHPIYI